MTYLRKIIIPWFRSGNLLGNVGGDGEGFKCWDFVEQEHFFFFP